VAYSPLIWPGRTWSASRTEPHRGTRPRSGWWSSRNRSATFSTCSRATDAPPPSELAEWRARRTIAVDMGASNLIRLGILALPLAGLLSLVGLLSRYGTPNPRIDTEAAARTAASAGYFVSQYIGNVVYPGQTSGRQHAPGVEPLGSGELRPPTVQQSPGGCALASSVLLISNKEQSSSASRGNAGK
jgi:hypothetical protein